MSAHGHDGHRGHTDNAAGPTSPGEGIARRLGLADALAQLQQRIGEWVDGADSEMREALQWQFRRGTPKYFRPLTIFSCHQALHGSVIDDDVLLSAQVLEMFHNVSLIIDDIVDRSPLRRGQATLHARFGELPALMVAGYIVADGYDLLARQVTGDDAFERYRIRLMSELMKRLGVAECLQWRLRRQPLGLDDWRRIAGEDTGSMFEVCACLGGRGESLRHFGRLLGTLYHGCDDVADVNDCAGLGGGGLEDLTEGILTLPAALAIAEPATRARFLQSKGSVEDVAALRTAFQAQVTAAENVLDHLATQAKAEAARRTPRPERLHAMVDHTRGLSSA